MNWEVISAPGQLVAAVGVIPFLIYLAIQIREQNKSKTGEGELSRRGINRRCRIVPIDPLHGRFGSAITWNEK